MSEKSKLISTYVKMLTKKRELKEAYEAKIKKIDESRAVVAKAMLEAGEYEEIPDIICEDDPDTAWKIGIQNNAYAIHLYRIIRDCVQAYNRRAKDHEALQNLYKEKIGNWILNELNKSGAKSVNCGEAGKAYKKLKVRANAADWDAFLKWAAENDAGDAIQKRINSSFITKYEEENDELPPFIDVFKEFDIVVTK